jgi:TatD DNase family protein
MHDLCFWDVHTHLQFAAYDADRETVIRRAVDAGVGCITAGTERNTSRAAVELAEGHDGIFAAIGLHPVHTGPSFHDDEELGGGVAISSGERFDETYYRSLAMRPKTVAIGECGLDYFRFPDGGDRDVLMERQKEALAAQISLAAETRKPLVIHCRSAFDDLIGMLRVRRAELGGRASPGVIHFFTGTRENARDLLNLGFSFTFGGAITFPPRKGQSAGTYDDLISFIPANRILSETDAPYVAPVPHRGERNEPAYVIEVVEKLSELKRMTVPEMTARIRENARQIFGV